MNTTQKIGKIRHIEGASQRIQEDTMRFATIVEDLGVELIKSVMVLIAFYRYYSKFQKKYLSYLSLVKSNTHWCGRLWFGLSWVRLF
jgi:peptide/bleomycin uptake transporter